MTKLVFSIQILFALFRMLVSSLDLKYIRGYLTDCICLSKDTVIYLNCWSCFRIYTECYMWIFHKAFILKRHNINCTCSFAT